jgi:outer membrane receptor protein involved in Fe transport
MRAWLLSTVAICGWQGCAWAQDLTPLPAAESAAPETQRDQDIIVTGSRIARRDFTAESPITTVNKDFLENTGPATVDQSLNQLPQFQATQNAQTSSVGGSGAGSSGGRANANLRGLGAPRTLVLFDGRRLQPSDVQGAIDLNTISPALISSVEVITGGASAVYGSDAIAGVVNFRFNNGFRGFELTGDAGVTDKGDGANYSGSLTWGGALLNDRARLFVSGSYLQRGTASRQARRFFDNRLGTSSPTSGAIVQSGTNPFGAGSAASIAAYRNLFTNVYGTPLPPSASSIILNTDGTLIGRNNASNLRPNPLDGYVVDETGIVSQVALLDGTVQLPLERYTAFARGEFEVSPALTLYAQGNYATYTTDQTSESGVLQSVVGTIAIRADNPFVTPDLRTLLNSRPRPNDPFGYYFTSTRIGQVRVKQDYDVYQLLGGAKGDLGGSLRYDIYVSHGETRNDESAFNQVSRSRFNAVVNGVGPDGRADGGRSQCEGGYDPFGFTPTSPSCAAYLTFSTANRYRFSQTVVQGNLSGELFELPGGPIGFNLGAEYRRNDYRADIDPRNSPTPTAVPGVTTSPEALGSSGALSSGGDIAVREFYGELLLPLLRDRPFFRSLELDLAYRYSDYDRIGGVHTYKASGNWTPFDGVAIRGGYSRAIRAPSLGDLYSPRSGATGIIGLAPDGAGDPCDVRGAARTGKANGVDPAKVVALCVANGVPQNLVGTYRYSGRANAAFRVGNPDLNEETADSYTVGAVFQPDLARALLKRFSFSVDYYNIAVEDAIGYVTSPLALNQCFNLGGLNPTYDPDNYYCQLIKRDSAGVLAYIDEPLFNLGRYQTAGLDFQVDAAIGLGEVGTFSVNSAVTYVMDYKIQSLSTEPTFDYAGTIGNTQVDGFSSTHPRWKHVTTATVSGSAGSLALRWRYIGEQSNSGNVGTAGTAPGVPSVSYFDLIGRLVANKDFELRAGITNIADKQPPEFGGPATTATSTYDIIGRSLFVGATARF